MLVCHSVHTARVGLRQRQDALPPHARRHDALWGFSKTKCPGHHHTEGLYLLRGILILRTALPDGVEGLGKLGRP